MNTPTHPSHLGMATTRQLLEEISARCHPAGTQPGRWSEHLLYLADMCQTAAAKLPSEILDYRTVEIEAHEAALLARPDVVEQIRKARSQPETRVRRQAPPMKLWEVQGSYLVSEPRRYRANNRTHIAADNLERAVALWYAHLPDGVEEPAVHQCILRSSASVAFIIDWESDELR